MSLRVAMSKREIRCLSFILTMLLLLFLLPVPSLGGTPAEFTVTNRAIGEQLAVAVDNGTEQIVPDYGWIYFKLASSDSKIKITLSDKLRPWSTRYTILTNKEIKDACGEEQGIQDLKVLTKGPSLHVEIKLRNPVSKDHYKTLKLLKKEWETENRNAVIMPMLLDYSLDVRHGNVQEDLCPPFFASFNINGEDDLILTFMQQSQPWRKQIATISKTNFQVDMKGKVWEGILLRGNREPHTVTDNVQVKIMKRVIDNEEDQPIEDEEVTFLSEFTHVSLRLMNDRQYNNVLYVHGKSARRPNNLEKATLLTDLKWGSLQVMNRLGRICNYEMHGELSDFRFESINHDDKLYLYGSSKKVRGRDSIEFLIPRKVYYSPATWRLVFTFTRVGEEVNTKVVDTIPRQFKDSNAPTVHQWNFGQFGLSVTYEVIN